MRNFGNDSFATQRNLPHHQFPPLSAKQIVSSPASPAFVKMEAHHSAKSIGVGTNPKKSNKTHFSPATVAAPFSHHQNHHHNNINGQHNSNVNNNYTNNNNNPNNLPINLSHGQLGTPTAATTFLASPPTSETTSVHHLPTVALAAACPTTSIRGPSPAHHHHQQQSSINGLPYHSSHSPTLPMAHTALPSEVHANSTSGLSSSNRSSPMSIPTPHSNTIAPNSPYHHMQYHMPHFNKIHNLTNGISAGTVADLSQNNQSSSASPLSNSSQSGSTPQPNAEVTKNFASTRSEDSSSPNSRSTSSVADSNNAATSRIVSQNVNGTYAITGIPSNGAELQVFRVMQRANLLSYFDKLIENGGDDVQQLCDSGNEEFLEIMALIGMAAKPLHVRRLQKALQEWMTQPSLFQSPVLPAGYQHHFGVSHIDRTISHTQFTTTAIAAAANGGGNATTSAIGPYPPQNHHPVIPIPHLIPHNPISPYPAQNAPLYAQEPPRNSSASTSNDISPKVDDSPAAQQNSSSNKIGKSYERSSNSSSPSLPSNAAETIVGLDKVYLQRGSPSTPVVISTAQSYNSGQGLSSSCSSSFSTEHYQSCPSPSGSTSSNSSTVSIKSHRQFHHPSSPLESSPDSPVNSESGRSISNKHESSTCTELENASSSSSSPPSSDQTNSIQLWDNSTGTGTLRVASRSSSYCGSVGGGSEPSSPAPPPLSFSKGILISSSSYQQQTYSDSPRPSTESVTNRYNNSVAVTSTTSSQGFSSLQEHEIQKLTETAMNIVRSLPPHLKEPKLSKTVEKSSYEFVRRLAEDDPRRMDEIRRISAIYRKTGENGKRSKGNSGSSRSVSPSNNKTMSILELAMNEAAAQLCKLLPALLTKRDEMYRLASQVIRDSGLPYEVICANSNLPNSFLVNRANNESGLTTSSSSKGKIDDIRNSPAHEERISNEFAAACKKIKLDMPGNDLKEMNGSSRKSTSEGSVRIAEVYNPLRKSPSRENKTVASSTLKKMAQGTSEYRKNSMDNRRSQS